jgi:hypothetical protein
MVRLGIGYDVHALVAGRKLILGGGGNQPLPSSSFEAIL